VGSLTSEQEHKISLLSDTVLYPEAASFMKRLTRELDCVPLPTSQITGLFNIANSAEYNQLNAYVIHQRDRNWPDYDRRKRSIGVFYTELEKLLSLMRKKRLKDEFRLLAEGLSVQQENQEANALMAALAREFIQHVVAENNLLASSQNVRR
jgi:hypothetical protein